MIHGYQNVAYSATNYLGVLQITALNGVEVPANREGMELYVRNYREDRKWSLDELGERVGMSKATVSRIERGEVEINLRQIAKFAEALNVQPSDLFGEEPWEIHRAKTARRQDKLQTIQTLLVDVTRHTSEPMNPQQAAYLASVIIQVAEGDSPETDNLSRVSRTLDDLSVNSGL